MFNKKKGLPMYAMSAEFSPWSGITRLSVQISPPCCLMASPEKPGEVLDHECSSTARYSCGG